MFSSVTVMQWLLGKVRESKLRGMTPEGNAVSKGCPGTGTLTQGAFFLFCPLTSCDCCCSCSFMISYFSCPLQEGKFLMDPDRVLLMNLSEAQTQIAIGCIFSHMLSVASLEDDFFLSIIYTLNGGKFWIKLGLFKVRNMDCLRGVEGILRGDKD